MKHECGLCAYWYKGHCSNSDSRSFNEGKLECETCGHWTMLLMKECPFCGGRPILDRFIRRENPGKKTSIPCVKCAACKTKRIWVPKSDPTNYAEAVRMAVYAWNQRATEELCKDYSNVHSAVEYHT